MNDLNKRDKFIRIENHYDFLKNNLKEIEDNNKNFNYLTQEQEFTEALKKTIQEKSKSKTNNIDLPISFIRTFLIFQLVKKRQAWVGCYYKMTGDSVYNRFIEVLCNQYPFNYSWGSYYMKLSLSMESIEKEVDSISIDIMELDTDLKFATLSATGKPVIEKELRKLNNQFHFLKDIIFYHNEYYEKEK